MPHFEKIYIQENFRRSPGDDPFLYGNIGVSVFINPGDKMEEAEQAGKEYIKDYISRNTQYHDHQHIEIRTIPDIQVEKEEKQSLEEMIMSCTEFKVLESYYLIVKNNPALQNVYDIKKKQLVAKESQEIIDKTNAYYSKK